VRAAEHCPISILQAHGGGAIPRRALSTIDRFVAVSCEPAVELPVPRPRQSAKVRAGRARRFSQPANARPKSEYFTRCSPPQSSVALDHYTDGSQVTKVHTSVQRPGTATGGVTAGRRRGGGGEHCLLDVLAEELAMEVVTHGVVNEAALLLLRLARLVLEDHVVVPPGTR
jgi:hypothetical protein